ncbi:MAG: outer membrane beta-barrel protein [Pyrinomonadaceae bacterium]|nr:outer membrane beta-barrel protein [Pyrinomonadaceae bacterium]
MKYGNSFFSITILTLILSVFAFGQTAKKTVTASKTSSSTQKDWSKLFSFDAFASGFYDTNIDHDDVETGATGTSYGAVVRFKTSEKLPVFKVRYEIANNYFNNSNSRWNRITHDLTASFEAGTKRVAFETVANMNLKGSIEEREITDYYSVKQLVKFRLDKRNRIIGFGTYRIKRYQDNPLKNSKNPIGGVNFEHSFGRGRILEVGYRFERNKAEQNQHSYNRATYKVEYKMPLVGKSILSLDAQYRQYKYDTINSIIRRDKKWIANAQLDIPISKRFVLSPSYRFENRRSNVTGKDYNANLFGVTLRFKWRADD